MPSSVAIDFLPKIIASQLLIDTIGANKVCQTPPPQSSVRETAIHRRANSSVTVLQRLVSQAESLSDTAISMQKKDLPFIT
jgi:hypothetical protein